MEVSKKKLRLMTAKNITIIVISIIIGIVGIVLSCIFDLYDYIGTIGGIVINALIFFGAFGALEIDDWAIWLKRLIIKKYNGKNGKLIIKVYDNSLTKKWLEIPVTCSYNVTNDQAIVWNLRMYKNTSMFTLECSINPITNGVTITDTYGKTYKCGKEQYSYGNVRTDTYVENFCKWLKEYTGERILYSINPDSLTIELNK